MTQIRSPRLAVTIVTVGIVLAGASLADAGLAQTTEPLARSGQDTVTVGTKQDESTTGQATEPTEPYVRDLMQAVAVHPSLRAAAAAVRAAELQLASARQPLELQVEASYTRLAIEGDNAASIPQPSPRASVRAIAHPFPYGDLADLVAQREVELARARLSQRNATAQLETQALDAAAGVVIARWGVELAESGLALAQTLLEVTTERAARGAARAADVTRAAQEVASAEADAAQAEDRLALARLSLDALTGGAALPVAPEVLPTIAVAGGELPAVTRAKLDLALAEIGLGAAQRNLYPVAQASYTWNLDDDRGALTVGLESRTLSPSLSYSTGSAGGVAPGATAGATTPAFADLPPLQVTPAQTEPSAPRVAGSFTVGVSMTISPERFWAVDAAAARVAAADASVEAARQREELNRLSLQHAIEAAERRVEIATTALDLVLADRDDVERRVALGLATELDLLRAEAAVDQASFSLLQARGKRLRAHLDTYADAAIPVSEVLK